MEKKQPGFVSLSISLNEYQVRALETAVFPDMGRGVYPALGLAGEAGELCENIKKIYRDDGGLVTLKRRETVEKELGDVLWYVAVLADAFGFTLERIAATNISKLSDRAMRGVLKGSGDNR